MLKLLLVAALKEKLTHYGKPTYGSMRWKPTVEFVGSHFHGIDPETKSGRKALRDLDIMTSDFSLLDDNMLVEFYDHVSRRFWMCM